MAAIDGLLPAPPDSDSGLSSECRRILEVIDALPPDEREAFDLCGCRGCRRSRPRKCSVLCRER